MTKCVAVFRSKTELFTFINYLKYQGALVETVATPKEARIGCGISAKFDERFFRLAIEIIENYTFSRFFGIYKIKHDGVRRTSILVYT